MANIWRKRIEAGTQKFEDCPSRYRAEVLDLMRKDVAEDKITVEMFEQLTGLPYEA